MLEPNHALSQSKNRNEKVVQRRVLCLPANMFSWTAGKRMILSDQGEDSMELLDSGSALAEASENTLEDYSILEYTTYQSSEEFFQTEASSSKNAVSSSLLERQRQILATLTDDLCPPPSAIVIDNESAMVREKREETSNAVPKTAVMDDGEDSTLIIRDMSKAYNKRDFSQHPSLSSFVAPVVHTVNKGDDECMILDVIELPARAVSHTVAATQESEYKRSMCSEDFSENPLVVITNNIRIKTISSRIYATRPTVCPSTRILLCISVSTHEKWPCLGTLLRSLGCAVVSDLYFQPKDEVLHKQAQGTKGRFAIPTQCSRRSFLTHGDAFTTCPEDPLRCFALFKFQARLYDFRQLCIQI
ncbi:hypothetical protein KIN20_007912 [Parelaphostrongylus tenuis]|uniref:Uncharacterized protein n=1 Tax=Parelaphostrongylus tenuis TaxID=148309 RepID=A0AAD5QMC6_PARTN|nr:hypothetical protein KIN20_007912 [Parelaphostrongylus tenuis]